MRLDHLLSRETVLLAGQAGTLFVFLVACVAWLGGGRDPLLLLLLLFLVGGVGGGMLSGSGAACPGCLLAFASGLVWGWGWGWLGGLVVNCIADASINDCLFSLFAGLLLLVVVLRVLLLFCLFCLFCLCLFVLFFWAFGGCLGTRSR